MIPARIYYARLEELRDEYNDIDRARSRAIVRGLYADVVANLLRAHPHATRPAKL